MWARKGSHGFPASVWSRATLAKSAAAPPSTWLSESQRSFGSQFPVISWRQSRSSCPGAGVCGFWLQQAPASAKAPPRRMPSSSSSSARATSSLSSSAALSAGACRRIVVPRTQAATSMSRGSESPPPNALGNTASRILSCISSLVGCGTFASTSPKAEHMAKRTAGSSCVLAPVVSSLISGSVRADSRTSVPRDSAAFWRTASEGSARQRTYVVCSCGRKGLRVAPPRISRDLSVSTMAFFTVPGKRSPTIRIKGPVIFTTYGFKASSEVWPTSSPRPLAASSRASAEPNMRPCW
mmetsp:Transcript_124175/g.386696  ORF Transcript_124175/g.386696 Transcript_124175/m.386696 type:complete len:296 (-) Transcript_124175:471-1358(-)